MSRMGASSNRAAAVRIGQNCRISMHVKLTLAWPIGVERPRGRLLTCACLMCPATSSYSVKFFPNGCNLTLWRKKRIPTKDCLPPPPCRNAIRITSASIHELPSAESNRAQILRRSFRKEIPLRNRVRCRDSACTGVDLSENDRFPGRPYHNLPPEKLNRVQPKSLLYQLSHVGAERQN